MEYINTERSIIDERFYDSCFSILRNRGIAFFKSMEGVDIEKEKIYIESMIGYFEETEEYEKCAFLRDLLKKI